MRTMLAFGCVLVVTGALHVEAVGGLATHGVGVGTLQSPDGQLVCPDSPFFVQVLYVPGDEAILHVEAEGSCLGTHAVALLTGQIGISTASGPLVLDLVCEGREATGVHCVGLGGSPLADVGPYTGAGSTVTFHYDGAFLLDGAFTAV